MVLDGDEPAEMTSALRQGRVLSDTDPVHMAEMYTARRYAADLPPARSAGRASPSCPPRTNGPPRTRDNGSRRGGPAWRRTARWSESRGTGAEASECSFYMSRPHGAAG